MFSLFLSLVKSFKAFSPKYTIRGTWNVPYVNLTNPILIVHEPTRQYTNKYNGLEQIWNSGPEEKIHRKIVVADNKSICYGYSGEWDIELTQFLPNPEGFQYIGMRQKRGIICELWEKKEATPKPQTWQIYINPKNGHPVSYVAHAISMFHSHYDIYILDIDEFIPEVPPGYFNFPIECDNIIGDDPYPGKNLKSNGEQNIKNSIINRSQWIKKLGGRRSTISNENEEVCRLYKYQGSDLPKEFSWRNSSNIVGPPRDQVACGSCWAFGTAESLESQLALKTGIFRELSVNQIMDCTWDYNNYGCQGGEAGPAFRSMIKQNLGLALEVDYPYLGVNGICNRKVEKPIAKVIDCLAIEKKTNALKEAIYKFGPASIGINVIESMSFYTKGVIDDQTCVGSASDLLHEVLLTGWRIIDGKEAWEIKNSWSTHWGFEGYIYIQSENQEWNCGVTTDAKIPIIEII